MPDEPRKAAKTSHGVRPHPTTEPTRPTESDPSAGRFALPATAPIIYEYAIIVIMQSIYFYQMY